MSHEFITLIGFFAGTLTVSSFFPQVIKAVKTKKTKDLSYGMYFILVTSNLIWIYYGFLINSASVYATNIAIGMLASFIIFLKIKNDG